MNDVNINMYLSNYIVDMQAFPGRNACVWYFVCINVFITGLLHVC